MSETDPFAEAVVIPGLEHLGRAIVDANGVPSGSPANFEATRGKGAEPLTPEAYADIVTAIASELDPNKSVDEAHPWANDPASNETTPD